MHPRPTEQGRSRQDLPRTQAMTERAFAAFDRFIHIEAVSGVVLLAAAAAALIWANSPLAHSYHDLWHTPVSFGFGDYVYSQSLHFWINDALMTVFFLVVGLEIRREIHDGALSSFRQASLPIAAALGGVAVPALIYLALNSDAVRGHGWAVPTATDIAFAVGVLALLGKRVPGNVRVFLLAVAIIDDIAAVVIIALFYSGGLNYVGFIVAAAGIAMVIVLQRMGIGKAVVYLLPGTIVWVGLLMTGAHPTLAGVALGLLTPVVPARLRQEPAQVLAQVASKVAGQSGGRGYEHELLGSLRQVRRAEREILPPVVRVQASLHPWVAFGVMPLFALANAGVSVGGIDLSAGGAMWVAVGVAAGLVIGKPLGVVLLSWLAVRLGLCRLPPNVTWGGVWLIGLLAGIGFTMSIFIAMLAFSDAQLVEAAKLGVLAASLAAALLGVFWGAFWSARRERHGTGK